jgi:hypothetical protein
MRGNRSTGRLAALACLALAAAATHHVFAQELRRVEYEYLNEPHNFGSLCEYGIRARGAIPIPLFAAVPEVRKAEVRSIKDWEVEVARLFGPRYGGWTQARGKEVHCEEKGLEFICTAFAHPCRER